MSAKSYKSKTLLEKPAVNKGLPMIGKVTHLPKF
jgi:hypothetical protein